MPIRSKRYYMNGRFLKIVVFLMKNDANSTKIHQSKNQFHDVISSTLTQHKRIKIIYNKCLINVVWSINRNFNLFFVWQIFICKQGNMIFFTQKYVMQSKTELSLLAIFVLKVNPCTIQNDWLVIPHQAEFLARSVCQPLFPIRDDLLEKKRETEMSYGNSVAMKLKMPLWERTEFNFKEENNLTKPNDITTLQRKSTSLQLTSSLCYILNELELLKSWFIHSPHRLSEEE